MDDATKKFLDENVGEIFEFFQPMPGITQQAATGLIGQKPKFKIEDREVGELKIIWAQVVPGGVNIRVQRIED